MSDETERWRAAVDRLKRKAWVLKLADHLGRGRGRFRPFDANLRRGAAATPNPSGGSGDLAATWIGHATMLYRVGGVTVLTDPVWSGRVGLGVGLAALGPKRLNPPAVRLSKLPPIDLILLTHAHFDHLDRPTLHRLPKTSRVICAPGTRDLVDDLGFAGVAELAPGESADVGGLRVSAVAVNHWGPRVFFDAWRGYVGYILEAADGRILHTGDTADTRAFDGTGPYDLGTFGIGAYDPYVAAHATPEQAWRMARAAGCRHVAAYHHTTFRLSREPTAEPLRRLLAAAGGEAGQVVIRRVGDQWVRDGGAAAVTSPSRSSCTTGPGRA